MVVFVGEVVDVFVFIVGLMFYDGECVGEIVFEEFVDGEFGGVEGGEIC